MKRERIDKIQRIELQVSLAEMRLAKAAARADYHRNRLRTLREVRLKHLHESGLPLGPSTRKNQKKYLVYASVRRLLNERSPRSGMTTPELYAAAQEEHPRLNIVTFRAYLREFGSRALIKLIGDRWYPPGEAERNPYHDRYDEGTDGINPHD